MRQSHSLIVPLPSALVVDLQTVIWFLHMVIFSYRECICCGKRRRTVEAVQQHMTSTGHCRFDVTEEMRGFYDPDLLARQASLDGGRAQLNDDHTIKLPSGKLLAHRSSSSSSSSHHVEPSSPRRMTTTTTTTVMMTMRSRQRDKPHVHRPSASALRACGSSSQPTTSPDDRADAGSQALAVTTREEEEEEEDRTKKERVLAAELGQLRISDRTALAHLPPPQQRSLLLTYKKALDGAKRAERRTQRRLDNVGNKTAVHTKYYKQEVPIYQGG